MRETALGIPTVATHVAMLGWFPLCLALFVFFKPARAACYGLVAGLLLLPNVAYPLQGLPDYDKNIAIGFGVTLAALAFDSARFLRLRPRWIDLPVAMLCLSPLVSSILNGLGTWNGLSGTFDFFVRWAIPWFLGRLYVSDPRGQQTFLIAIVVGAVLYVPLCAWEVKMSPNLHSLVYGIKLKAIKHASRGAFWKPNVFLSHGLMLALFMACATTCCYQLWASKLRRAIQGVPTGLLALGLGITTLACSSKNALIMMFTGLAALFVGNRLRWGFPLVALCMVGPLYVGVRQGIGWEGKELVGWAEETFGRERAISLNIRLRNENMLAEPISERLWFGYSDFRALTGNTEERNVITVDSMWLLFLSVTGLFSLIALYGTLLLAPILVWRRIPARLWTHPTLAPSVALSMMCVLLCLDFLLNAHENPLVTVAAGGVAHMLGTREGRATWMEA